MDILEANIYDSEDILNWRNDPLTRSMSISSEEITIEEHHRWFLNCLTNPLDSLFIGMLLEKKIGVCRFNFDSQSKFSEVSINLNPLMRGNNLSFPLLYYSVLKYQELNNYPLKSTIKKINTPSLKIFQKCGFKIVNEINDRYFLNLNARL